jgi:hypothetical protein
VAMYFIISVSFHGLLAIQRVRIARDFLFGLKRINN